MLEDYGLGDLITYIFENFGNLIEGSKKLLKLLFLIQYERINNSIIKYYALDKPIARSEFFIWYYGPFSNTVYQFIDQHIEIDTTKRPYKLFLSKKISNHKLPETVQERVDKILARYKNKTGHELELLVNATLGLDTASKLEHMGWYVDDYIKQRFKLMKIDLLKE